MWGTSIESVEGQVDLTTSESSVWSHKEMIDGDIRFPFRLKSNVRRRVFVLALLLGLISDTFTLIRICDVPFATLLTLQYGTKSRN